MSNKISIISDASLCPRTGKSSYAYRIGIDGEYITGRGVFKWKEKHIHLLELAAQEMALNHLMSWFRIPEDCSVTCYMDNQGGRSLIKQGKKEGQVIGKILGDLRERIVAADMQGIKGHLIKLQHDICHKEAELIRRKRAVAQ